MGFFSPHQPNDQTSSTVCWKMEWFEYPAATFKTLKPIQQIFIYSIPLFKKNIKLKSSYHNDQFLSIQLICSTRTKEDSVSIKPINSHSIRSYLPTFPCSDTLLAPPQRPRWSSSWVSLTELPVRSLQKPSGGPWVNFSTRGAWFQSKSLWLINQAPPNIPSWK